MLVEDEPQRRLRPLSPSLHREGGEECLDCPQDCLSLGELSEGLRELPQPHLGVTTMPGTAVTSRDVTSAVASASDEVFGMPPGIPGLDSLVGACGGFSGPLGIPL